MYAILALSPFFVQHPSATTLPSGSVKSAHATRVLRLLRLSGLARRTKGAAGLLCRGRTGVAKGGGQVQPAPRTAVRLRRTPAGRRFLGTGGPQATPAVSHDARRPREAREHRGKVMGRACDCPVRIAASSSGRGRTAPATLFTSSTAYSPRTLPLRVLGRPSAPVKVLKEVVVEEQGAVPKPLRRRTVPVKSRGWPSPLLPVYLWSHADHASKGC